MARAERTARRLMVLGGAGVTCLLVVSTPAAARPAEPQPLPLPSPSLSPVELPPLDGVLAPVTGALQEPLAAVESLLSPPPASTPAPPAASTPAPAEPVASSPTPLPAAAPAPVAAPSVAPTAGASPADAEGAPAPALASPARPASPAAEPAIASRGSAEAIADATRSFTPLFLLAAAIVVFLVVQGRLDRREAKLATAPVVSDMLEFR
jgi:hypothetical protein